MLPLVFFFRGMLISDQRWSPCCRHCCRMANPIIITKLVVLPSDSVERVSIAKHEETQNEKSVKERHVKPIWPTKSLLNQNAFASHPSNSDRAPPPSISHATSTQQKPLSIKMVYCCGYNSSTDWGAPISQYKPVELIAWSTVRLKHTVYETKGLMLTNGWLIVSDWLT